MRLRHIGVFLILLYSSLIHSLICGSYALAGQKPVLFPGGEPGCLHLVSSKVLSKEEIKALPARCKNFHQNYSRAVVQLADAPEVFSLGLIKTIDAARVSGKLKSPYDALLLAALSSDVESQSAVRTYATFEKKRNVYFKYASAVLERLENGSCKNFSGDAYREICSADDQILKRLAALNRSIQVGRK